MAIPTQLLLLGGLALGGPDSTEGVVDAAREILRERGSSDQRTEADVARELAALGEPAVEVLFGMVAGGETLESLYEVPEDDADGWRWWGRPDAYGDVAMSALADHRPEPTLEYVGGLLERSSALDERLAALHVTAAIPTVASFERWAELALAFDEDDLLALLTRVSLRKSLVAHLGHSTAPYEELEAVVGSDVHPILREEIQRAVADCDDPRGVHVLFAYLELDPETQQAPPLTELIPRIDGLVRRFPWVDGGRWQEELRRFVTDPDPGVRAVATKALRGSHEDYDLLLELLEIGDLRQASAARSALIQSFRLTVGMSDDDWRRRVGADLVWWDSEGADSVHELTELEADRAARRIRELAGRTSLRPVIAKALGEGLGHMSPEVARAALVLILELGEPGAVPGLVETLRWVEDELVGEVTIALEILTGLDLGRDPQAWRDALLL